MSSFYTNVFMRGNKVYVRGYDKGIRVKYEVEYQPYVFVLDPKGSYKSIDGKNLTKIDFNDIYHGRDYLKNHEGIENSPIYGFTGAMWPYLYIYDTFKGDIDYDIKMTKIGILDIECASDEGFPDIYKADKKITAITIRCRGRNYVFGYEEFTTDDPNTFYIQCPNEANLLFQFLQCWKALDLDIITGWNTEWFDIPYLINRIRALGMQPNKLSPYGVITEHEVEIRGKKNIAYNILGIASLDYLQLYKKFSFSNHESYKLDYIASVEIGEKKIDYSEYGDLLELYKNDHQKFIEYNIHDTVLVDKLDDKLKLFEQIMALAYDAKVNYIDTLTTVRQWDVIIHNYLMDQNIVISPMKKNRFDGGLVGGYVKEPRIGLTNWVVSFDLNSLYPHLIMQYNISPETYVEKISIPSIDELLKKESDYVTKDAWAAAANGCVYRKDKQGFLPALMERMYDDRVKYKSMMLEAKKSYEQTKSIEDSKLIARYHNMQLAKKIQLNSAYGALGNQYFRWFSFDLAESITMSGQLSIRWIENKINSYMNKLLKTDNKDYVIASDTDSIYVDMSKLIPKSDEIEEIKIVEAIDKFCETKIQPYIDQCYQELADFMGASQQKMKMKRETIANKGIWRGKKMYILNAWNVEGVQYDKPKLKIQGIEAVRSSTPHVCREKIKEGLSIIMNGSRDELKKFVEDFRQEFLNLPFEDVAFPRGLNGMSDYRDNSSVYKKGTPIHVKGSLLFNSLLKKYNIKNIPPLVDGDKIKYAYLKVPNPLHDTVIASGDYLPKEFKLDAYIDRDMQFKKSFLDPITSITEIIGWDLEDRATLESFFS